MKKFTIAFVGMCTVAAVGQPPAPLPGVGTPGWQYGGYNCGCVTSANATRASCVACCNAAAIPSGPLTPGQVTTCLAFCAQAVFPCNGTGNP